MQSSATSFLHHKATLFAKIFSRNSNFDDSGISLAVFPPRTYLKLHNISITPKMVKKVITNLDSSKASCPDCISGLHKFCAVTTLNVTFHVDIVSEYN